MYFQTCLYVTGNRTVWSEDIFPLVSTILTWARWAQAPVISSFPVAVIISDWLLLFLEEVLLFLMEMHFVCVDDFSEMLLDEGCC